MKKKLSEKLLIALTAAGLALASSCGLIATAGPGNAGGGFSVDLSGGSLAVKLAGVTLARNYEDERVIIIFLDVENKGSSVQWPPQVSAVQNGETLYGEADYALDMYEKETGASYKRLLPGASVRTAHGFILADESPLTLHLNDVSATVKAENMPPSESPSAGYDLDALSARFPGLITGSGDGAPAPGVQFFFENEAPYRGEVMLDIYRLDAVSDRSGGRLEVIFAFEATGEEAAAFEPWKIPGFAGFAGGVELEVIDLAYELDTPDVAARYGGLTGKVRVVFGIGEGADEILYTVSLEDDCGFVMDPAFGEILTVE